MADLSSLNASELVSILEALFERFGAEAQEIATKAIIASASSSSSSSSSSSYSQTIEESNISLTLKKVEEKKDVANKEKDNAATFKEGKGKGKEKVKNEFDMSRYRQRHIALQLQYEGGSYYGFAAQNGECDETVEKHLFEALLKLKLIESRKVSWERMELYLLPIITVLNCLFLISIYSNPLISDVQLQPMWANRQRCQRVGPGMFI